MFLSLIMMFSLSASARLVEGGVAHKLTCEPVRHGNEVSSLRVVTAGPPSYDSVRSIAVMQVVSSNSIPQLIQLQPRLQDRFVAEFSNERFEVVLDKRELTADVFVLNELEYSCR